MHRENPRSSRKSQFPSSSRRHRRAYNIVLGCRMKARPPLSRRKAVLWLPMSTSEPRRSPEETRAAVTLSRTATAATTSRGASAAAVEADLKQPGANLIVATHDNLPRRAPSCTRPATRCHHGARTPTQTNIFLHGVRRDQPLLSARRRAPALSVNVQAAILACLPRHPDHLEEEPAAGPSLTRRQARGKLSVEYSVIRRYNYKFQVMSKVSGPSSQVFTSSLRCQVYGVKSKVSSLWWCHVYGVWSKRV